MVPHRPDTPAERARWIDAVDVRLGTVLGVIGVLSGLVYSLMTLDDPHRDVIIAVLLAGLVSSLAVQFATPWLLADADRAQVFFPLWSLGFVIMIAALAALDGGAGSPVVYFFLVRSRSRRWPTPCASRCS